MIRPDSELHQINVAWWSRAEVFSHLQATFDVAARQHPDLFEPYLIRLDGADESEQMAIMRQARPDSTRNEHHARIHD